MNSREREARLFARCVEVARSSSMAAQDQREANVFRLAAMVLASSFESASVRLSTACDRYFDEHPDERLDGVEVLRRGWVLSMPRPKDGLTQKLREQGERRP